MTPKRGRDGLTGIGDRDHWTDGKAARAHDLRARRCTTANAVIEALWNRTAPATHPPLRRCASVPTELLSTDLSPCTNHDHDH